MCSIQNNHCLEKIDYDDCPQHATLFSEGYNKSRYCSIETDLFLGLLIRTDKSCLCEFIEDICERFCIIQDRKWSLPTSASSETTSPRAWTCLEAVALDFPAHGVLNIQTERCFLLLCGDGRRHLSVFVYRGV